MTDVSLTLYRNKKTKDYLIERYVGTRAVGGLAKVTSAEMQNKGMAITMLAFKEAPATQEGCLPGRSGFSKEEDRTFNSLHRSASISLSEKAAICLGPFRRRGSGYVVHKDEVVQLSASCTNEEFLAVLKDIFDQ